VRNILSVVPKNTQRVFTVNKKCWFNIIKKKILLKTWLYGLDPLPSIHMENLQKKYIYESQLADKDLLLL
jgi:hypothetical protein